MRLLKCFFLLLLLAAPAWAADVTVTINVDKSVTLAWDANAELDLAGYKVYWGNTSRTYTNSPVPTVAVSLAPTYTTPPLGNGTWYFAVTAFNTAVPPMESGYSNEVSAVIADVPNPPTGLRIVSISSASNWYGVVVLCMTNEPSSSTIRYRDLTAGSQWKTVPITPKPTRTQHRWVLWFPPGRTYYGFVWTVTDALGNQVSEDGTFVTK